MGKAIIIFIKHQKKYILFLLISFVLPVALLFQFAPVPVHKIQYLFLALLLVSQFYFFHAEDFYRKIKSDVTASLEKELRRTPSSKEIRARSIQIGQHRSICIGLATVGIFLVMLFFQEF